MKLDNPLVSREGFDFFLSALQKGHSKETIRQLTDSIVESPFRESFSVVSPPKSSSVRRLRKNAQREGVIDLIEMLGDYKNILELGTGRGQLAIDLSSRLPETKVTGVDSNPDLVQSAKDSTRYSGLSFVCADAFSYSPRSNFDLVLSLHGCGNLSDRAIDLAIDGSSDLICVPCCYSRISIKDSAQILLPRSKALAGRKELFRDLVLRNSSRLEGSGDDTKKTMQGVMGSAYRMLVDFDRMLYLKQKGYSVAFADITPKYSEFAGKRHANTSLSRSIIGIKA